MIDPSDHPDPKEATEAKLCAYLEGELAPADKAEIERHLAANPQHKTLLAELAKTRQWVRSIPRIPAPVDLAESFQSQVERNMLLNQAPVNTAPRRWPQVWMAAAIVLLVLGLGALVTLMLFPSGKQQVAVNKSTPGSSQGPADSEPARDEVRESKSLPAGVAAKAVAAVPAAGPSAGAPAGNQSDAIGALPPSLAPGEGDARKAVSAESSAASTKPTDLAAGALSLPWTPPVSGLAVTPGDRTVYVIVRTAKPQAAVDAAMAFFDQQHLAMVMPETARQPELVMRNATQSQISNNFGNAAAPTAMALNQQQRQVQKQAATMPTTNPADAAPAVIAGRGLTRAQVDQLAASLLEPASPGEVHVMMADHGRYADIGAVTPLSRGQSVLVFVPEMDRVGFDKSNVLKVADDGTVAMPMLGPVPAAGITSDALSKRIADQFRAQHVINQPTVAVAPLPAEPVPGAAGGFMTTTRATTGPTADAAAATGAGTGDYTVVIVTEPPGK